MSTPDDPAEVALGEVDDLVRPVDQDQAHGDQAVERAEHGAVEQDRRWGLVDEAHEQQEVMVAAAA